MSVFGLALWAGLAWAQVPPGAASGPPVEARGAPAAPGQVLDRVAAVVNDDIVTLGEIYEFGGAYIGQAVAAAGEAARGAAESEVLDRLLERRLIEQEMRALKLDLTEQEIDRSISEIAERNGLDVDGLAGHLADLKGRALMVHAGGDNHADHPMPLGGGGARVACGVID